ncbi:MAG TPA: FAD-dependent oxidoreductase [Mycobacteriales bacterium]|jgi:glycine/D-amino acid oxidase-like deaminating enzyme/nitrite reductase/ring-hydroxylating ferredoxin subunit|nr:FAD-dependent oxidoreductase [Mycobacteriales bacterium]
MSELPGVPVSYWIDSTEATDFPPLPDELEVDVAVLGGGIAGLSAAAALKAAGRTVAVVEAGRILEGVTGNTTAKVTASHGRLYAYLVDKFGEERARLYADSQQAAIEQIARVVETEGVDCDLVRTESYIYTEDPAELESLEQEVEGATRCGLPVSLVNDVPLPYDVAGAIRYDGQARFHPRKYLLHVARGVAGDGSVILENTRALDVDDTDPCVVTTDRGVLRARDVVVATHIPFLDRGMFFARQFPMRDYVVSARMSREDAPDGMFLSTEQPTHSIRVTEDGDAMLLIVGGEGHTTGREHDQDERWQRLEQWTRERFGVTEFTHRWATQDYTSTDRVPFVGRFHPGSKHLWVATAFGAWGMTNGTMSGLLLADLITGTDNPWAEVYDPGRTVPPVEKAKTFVKENLAVAKQLASGYLSPGDVGSVDELEPGQAAVIRDGLGKTAAYRDDDGVLHAVSASCTHLGCIVGWNPGEKSWDCPCHGSRFGVDGEVLHGPAVKPLAQVGASSVPSGDESNDASNDAASS